MAGTACDPMNALKHVMILASAGSGKTHALTNRFVELLAAGAGPERIVALTFTRKAAGEFFDDILRKLARAAREPDAARRLAVDISQPQFGPADFLRLLRQMVDAMHRLRLGTLDSFFARIARTFPLELGLSGEFEILQEHAARLERQRVLRRMFARPTEGLDAAQMEFIEAFKRATFGAEEKQLGALLDAFLDEYQENFLAAPDASAWGDPRRIWPQGARWFDVTVKLDTAAKALRESLPELTEGQRERWDAFFAALVEWTPGAVLPAAVDYILKNSLAVWTDLRRGGAAIVVDRRKLEFVGPSCEALVEVIAAIVGAELRRRIETTRGIFAVLRSYESNYHNSVRRAGRLTFADVQRLLSPVTLTRVAPSAATGRAEAEAEAGEARLFLDYRLDAGIDHWLLDEFQDTSFGQWSVLRNLIDEVVQDPEGRRSFFCVGDVKQAIYAWREGDPRLFREVFNHYNSGGAVITERQLNASWRSGPAVIEMVNAVFGSAVTLDALFPGPASKAWNREWRNHESALPDPRGHAALLHAPDQAGRWATVRALLEEIRPVERGLSCAILVRKNDTAAALADTLRAANIAALAESDLHVATDNPLGAALLALVQAAAHPGDTLTAVHIGMTPLAEVLAVGGITTPESLTLRVLGQIHADGFERTMAWWAGELESHLDPEDAFTRRRAREFVAAAGLFDATGSRDCGEFVAFMERHTIRAPESVDAVRVMTIHKSKGLGFDVVIVPDLQGNRIDEKRDGLAVCRTADRTVDWILDLPPRLFCSQDEVLAAQVAAAEAEACYESLSLLYVALTRAKRALYVITEPVGKSTSRNFPRLLANTLGDLSHPILVGRMTADGAWSVGDPRWHEGLRVERVLSPICRGIEPLPAVPGMTGHRLGVRPSKQGPGRQPADSLFALDNVAATDFGTALHALFAEIEWATGGDAARWEAKWRDRGEPPALVAAAVAALRAPLLEEVWHRPENAGEVWRERSFEIVLEDLWVTGVFDRVVVARRPDGAVSRVTVYDFKTDHIAGPADLAAAVARHDAQLTTYGRVAAVLAGTSRTAVTCRLVLTTLGRFVDVAMPT